MAKAYDPSVEEQELPSGDAYGEKDLLRIGGNVLLDFCNDSPKELKGKIDWTPHKGDSVLVSLAV